MKQKFIVPVVRIGHGFAKIEVEANSQEEANELALDEAGSYEFSEVFSDYEIEGEVSIKTSGELDSILDTIRQQILASYRATLNRLVDAYVDNAQSENNSDAHIGVETEWEGWVDLKRSILFSEPINNEDGNLTECIDAFHTKGIEINVRYEGDSDAVKIEELSNFQLIPLSKKWNTISVTLMK